jgi:putative ABC transport system permease protein
MNVIELSVFDLSLAAFLILALAILTGILRLGLSRQLFVAALRTTVQLLLLGLILKSLFAHTTLLWLLLMALIMLLAAGREVMRRQKRRFVGLWGFGLGTTAMFVSSFTITTFALIFIINNSPWYKAQYAIPLLGMMLGNTMNGISIGLDRLTSTAWQQRAVIEARLMLGFSWREAIDDIRKESIRSGLIPIINAMTVAGLVSLPGMMTGQILAGSPPIVAVTYQILIMFMIGAGTGFGTIGAIWTGSFHLFDERQRLRLDRLKNQANA